MRSVRSVGALTQFVEQPRVLDGDDGLGGEVFTSSICLSVKGRTSCRKRADCSDQLVILQHRNNKKRPYTPEFDGFDIRGTAFLYILLFGCKVCCVDQ